MFKYSKLLMMDKSSSLALTISAAWAFLGSASSSGAATPSEAQTAQRYYTAGDMTNAIRHFDADLRLSPTNATSHYLKANCLLKLNKVPEAVHEYSLAENLSPHSKLADYCRTARATLSARSSSSQPPASVNRTNARVLDSDDPDAGVETTKVSSQKDVADETRAVPRTLCRRGL